MVFMSVTDGEEETQTDSSVNTVDGDTRCGGRTDRDALRAQAGGTTKRTKTDRWTDRQTDRRRDSLLPGSSQKEA